MNDNTYNYLDFFYKGSPINNLIEFKRAQLLYERSPELYLASSYQAPKWTTLDIQQIDPYPEATDFWSPINDFMNHLGEFNAGSAKYKKYNLLGKAIELEEKGKTDTEEYQSIIKQLERIEEDINYWTQKRPVSKSYSDIAQIKRLMPVDPLDYWIFNGSDLYYRLPSDLAGQAYGMSGLAGTIASGILGKSIGTALAPVMSPLIGFGVSAGMTLAANFFARSYESSSEAGMAADERIREEIENLEKKKGAPLTVEEKNQIVKNAVTGMNTVYDRNQALVASEILQNSLILGSAASLFSGAGGGILLTKLAVSYTHLRAHET
jgi:hypothetical protein